MRLHFFIFTGACIALLAGCSPGPQSKSTATTAPKGDGPLSPRYAEQWLAMKQHPGAPLPQSFRARLVEQTRAQKTTAESNLEFIQELGPSNVGGRTRTLVVDAADSEHLITAGVSGGVWHSYNGGASWTPVLDQNPTLAVMSICQNPFNPDVLYFSTGEPTGNSADIDGDGVYKSTDRGLTWTKLPATDNPAYNATWDIVHSTTDSNTVFVGTDGFGLFRSTDGGQSFTQVLPELGAVTDVKVLPNGTVFAALNGKGIWRSATGAAGTWTELGGGLPTTNYRRIELAFCQNQPNNVYAAYEDNTGSSYDSDLQGVYRSTDGGDTWVFIGNPSEPPANVFFRFNWYAFGFGVKPDDPNTVVVGSVQNAVTTNGGINWARLPEGHADNHVFVFDPQNPERLYCGSDGGIHRYFALGLPSNPVSLNNGYNVTQYYAGAYFSIGDLSFGGTQDNGTNRFGGSAAFNQINGGDGAFTAISQQNGNLAFVSSQNGFIRRSNNALQPNPNFVTVLNELDLNNDGDVDEGTWFINPFTNNPADGTQVYFVTNSRVWRSTDAADSWVPLTNALLGRPYALGVSDAPNPTVYIGGAGSSLYMVENAATANPGDEIDLSASVPVLAAGSFIGEIVVDPTDPHTIYVCLTDYIDTPRLWKVSGTDRPNPLWQAIGANLPEGLPVNSVAPDPENPFFNLVVGTDFGVYSTTDGGFTWVKEEAIPNVAVAQVKARPSDRRVFIWTHGRGQWSAYFKGAGPDTTTARPETSVTDFSLYPVPATASITVELPEQLQEAQVRILDAKGAAAYFERPAPWQREITVNLSALSPGVYFAELSHREGVLRKRFVKR